MTSELIKTCELHVSFSIILSHASIHHHIVDVIYQNQSKIDI